MAIDEDLAGIIQKKAAQSGQSFKQVLNDLLRAGLAANGEAALQRPRLTVVGKPLGLKPGYDPDKLNQLLDDLARKQSMSQSCKPPMPTSPDFPV